MASVRELFPIREFVDAVPARPVVAEESVATDGHADPCRRDAPWASVPYDVDLSAADSSDALRDQHRADFSKCEPRVAAAMAHEDADADRDRLTNEI